MYYVADDYRTFQPVNNVETNNVSNPPKNVTDSRVISMPPEMLKKTTRKIRFVVAVGFVILFFLFLLLIVSLLNSLERTIIGY